MIEKKPITIVYIITALELAGVENQLMLLLERLDGSRFSPRVIAFFGGAMEQRFRDRGFAVELIPFRRSRLSVVIECWQRLRELKPDIVHSEGQTANVLGRAAAVLAGVPIVLCSEHSTASIKGRLRLMIDRVLIPFTSYFVSDSHHSADFYLRRGIIPADKIGIIRCGIDASAFPLAHGCADRPTLGAVGELRKEKKYPELLKSMSVIARELPKTRLEIAGDGPMRTQLQDRIASEGLADRVIMHGWVHNIAEFLSGLDVYIHASHYEGLPNAVMEAMACGLPCVAYDTSGCAELIRNGETGLLVPRGDFEALAWAAIGLLQAPEAAREMGRRGRELIAADFSVGKLVEAHISLYERLLAETASRPLKAWDEHSTSAREHGS